MRAFILNAQTNSAVQATVPLPAWGSISTDQLGYDGAGRMITKRYLTGGINGTTHAYNNTTALVGYTTSFDRASNKLYERHLEGGESRSHLYQPFNSDGSWGVGYDSANRLRQYQRGVLSSATIPYLVNAGASISTPITLPGADQVRTYGLDGLGNWKTSNFTPVGSGSTTEVRQHNYVNEITSVTDTTGGTPQTPVAFSYDKNGNLLNDGIRSYQYDAFNRLVNVSNASTSALLATYAYDGMNRRIQKTVSNGGLSGDIPNGTTNYLYDGQQMAMARDDDGNWTQVYFWGQYIDELLFFAVPTETVPTTYRVMSDLLYRSVAIVTTANVTTEAYDTDAYGNTLCYSGPGTDGLWFTNDDVKTNAPINTTIFTGRQYDPESQIYYYRARYYSPNIGRFISRDPMGTAGGINLYGYVGNNPANAMDPLGLLPPGVPPSYDPSYQPYPPPSPPVPPNNPPPGSVTGAAGVIGIISAIIAQIFADKVSADINAINACAGKPCKKQCFSCLQSALSQAQSDLLTATDAGYVVCASAAVAGLPGGWTAAVAYGACLAILDDQILGAENSVASAISAIIPKCQALP